MITDSGLVPAVRASRGTGADLQLISSLRSILSRLNGRHDLINEVDQKFLMSMMDRLHAQITTHEGYWYGAKGEILGSSAPLWRCRGNFLRGIGFNYDYADEEGPARDLRTGQLVASPSSLSIELIKVGDLLVTTGFDGIFPPGLRVASVTKVGVLNDSGYAYAYFGLADIGICSPGRAFFAPS